MTWRPLGEAIRPTKDVDLLGFGDTSADGLAHVFEALCAMESGDGLTFLPDSIQVQPIREDQEYGGMRVTLMAALGHVRIPVQVDVGTGDAVVPPPALRDFPGLLELPQARLRMYRPETSIAEKTEAIVRRVFVPTARTSPCQECCARSHAWGGPRIVGMSGRLLRELRTTLDGEHIGRETFPRAYARTAAQMGRPFMRPVANSYGSA